MEEQGLDAAKEVRRRLLLNIIRPKGKHRKTCIRCLPRAFIEMAIEHVPDLFTAARATPDADDGDLV